MKAVLQKQTSYLKLIADNTSSDNLIQKAQFAAQLKTDNDIKDDDKKTQANLILIKGVLQDSYKKSEEINDNVIKLSEIIQDSLISSNKSSEDSIEKKRTEEKVAANEEEQTSILAQLLEAIKKGCEKPKEGAKLGGLGTGLAVALGVLVGAIQGHIKAVIDITKFLTKGITSSFKFLFGTLPIDIQKKLIQLKDVFQSGYNLIKGYLSAAASSFMGLLKNASTFLDMQFTRVVKFLGDIPFKVMTFIDDILLKLPPSIGKPIMAFMDDVAKFIGNIPMIFKNVIDPVIDAFTTLKKASGPVTKVVNFVKSIFGNVLTGIQTIGSKLSFFGKIFTKVAGAMKSIAYPLTFIMAIYDTVMGAIEGFKKDGIIGGIKGAITGLFNSLVGGAADLLKSIVSWVAGALGFTGVEKFLDSFSFQDLFKGLVDSIFDFVGSIPDIIIDWFTGGSFDFLKSIVSWVAGALGFTEVEKALDAFSFKDLYRGAIDAIFGFMNSIGDWISSKIEAVKNFFGFGTKEKKENAQKNLKDARKDLTNAQAAATVGAIGVNDKGGVMTSLVETNGRFDREGARSNLESEGYREMTEDERNAYIEEKKKAVNDAEEVLKQVDQIPTLEKIWNDFNFADAISTMISKMFGTIPDMLKSVGSWIAGALGFTEIEKALDSFSFQDLFKGAVDSVFNFMKSIGDWISSKIESVKNFFGFGTKEKKENAQENLKKAQSDLTNTEFARRYGSVGVNERGEVSPTTILNNGLFDKDAARADLESRGYREMTDDELDAFTDKQKKRVKDADKALEQVEQIPTLEKIWEDFNFSDAISTMISKMFGTIPDLIKGAASWVAGKLGFDNIKKYLDSFSFTDIFKEVVDTILHPIDALTSLFNRVADGIEEYLVTPVTDMISDVKNLFKEYVSDPLKKHFEPISKFFSKMKDDMLNMFSNFGIPEISFKIPVIGKKVSIGPFYPFKDSAVTTSKTDTKSSSTSVEPSSDSTTSTSSERVRESSSPSLVEKVKGAYAEVKDSYGRGVSGTLDYQNRYDEINKRAIEQGIIDEGGTGRILDRKAYKKIEDQVLSEIGQKTANPSMMSEQLISAKTGLKVTSTREGESKDYRKSLDSGIVSEKALFGSTLLGSLVSEKGLKTGEFLSKSSEESSDEGRSINKIFGKRISGGLFSRDKYELSSGKERLDVSKEQYNRVQDLVKAGKAKEAAQEYTRVKMELEAKDNNTAEMLDPDTALIQSAALEKSEPRVLPIYEASKKNEDEKAAVQQNQAPVVISAPTTNNVSNNKQSIVMPTPVRQEDTSVMSYNRRGHAWSVY